MNKTIICLVIFVTCVLFLLPVTLPADDDTADEIIQLQQEIRELKQLFLKLAHLLPEEQKKQMETVIRDLELELEIEVDLSLKCHLRLLRLHLTSLTTSNFRRLDVLTS